MPEKLLFIINSLQGGGAERVLSSLATFFYIKGYRVSVVCLNYAEQAYEIPEGIKLIYLTKERKAGTLYRVYYAYSTYAKLYNIFKTERPHCAISFMTSANLWAGLVGRLTKTSYIVSERTNTDHIEALNSIQRWLLYKIYSRSKRVVVPCSGVEIALLQTEALKSINNTKIIINPVKVLGPVSHKSVNQKKYVLAAGRLCHEKGFDLLIDAFALVKEKSIDLLIVGEGEDREALENQIAGLGLIGRVKLIGARKNIQDYYHYAELFVLSSRNEGYPNVLIEAMSMGCPSIAMDCEFGPSEIINHEENGLLVKERSAAVLSQNIERLLSDRSLRTRLSKNAKLINLTNSTETVYAEWENLVHESIN